MANENLTREQRQVILAEKVAEILARDGKFTKDIYNPKDTAATNAKDKYLNDVTLQAMQEIGGYETLDKQAFQSAFTEAKTLVTNISTSVGGEMYSGASKKSIRGLRDQKAAIGEGVGNMILEASKAGMSIYQIAQGKANQAMNVLPEFTQQKADTKKLDSLINATAQKAAGVFPEREAARQRDAASIMAQSAKSARQFGVGGAGLAQQGAIQAAAGARRDRLGDETLRQNYSTQLQSLLNQREGINQFGEKQRERAFYDRDLDLYKSRANEASSLQRTGYENLAGVMEGLPRKTRSMVDLMNQYKDTRDYVNSLNQPQQPAYQPIQQQLPPQQAPSLLNDVSLQQGVDAGINYRPNYSLGAGGRGFDYNRNIYSR